MGSYYEYRDARSKLKIKNLPEKSTESLQVPNRVSASFSVSRKPCFCPNSVSQRQRCLNSFDRSIMSLKAYYEYGMPVVTNYLLLRYTILELHHPPCARCHVDAYNYLLDELPMKVTCNTGYFLQLVLLEKTGGAGALRS